jgi:ABC-2 type transport system permease protein
MNAALEFELLKARRAGVFRWGALVVAVGVPALCTAFFELVRLGGDSPPAAKAATMITELSLAGLLATAGQVLSVALLMTAGIAASWSFGREFVDDTLPALFAIATPRSSVAAAKFVVLAAWALLTVVSTVILSVIAGLLVGLDIDPAALQTASRVAVVGVLGAALAAPMALVSSWRRGYLPGFVALVAVVVVTQLVTAIGVGAWFPYAAPALWMGMGGAAAAQDVSVIQLLLPLPVAAIAVVATLSWWRRAEAR